VWAVPFYICLSCLGIALILREWQNQRTIQALLNRLLIKHGVDPIPDEHPLAEAIKELLPEREPWPPKDLGASKEAKRKRLMVTLPVPGMDILKTMLNKRKAG
jgi:hypothetical protein